MTPANNNFAAVDGRGATGVDAILGQFNTTLSLHATLASPAPPPVEWARILEGLRARQLQNSVPPSGPPAPVLLRPDELSLDALVSSPSATPTKANQTPKKSGNQVPDLLAAAFVVDVATAVDEQTVHLDETVHLEDTVHQEDTEVPEIPLPDLDMPFLFETEGPKRRRSSVSLSPRPSKAAKTE